MRSDSRYSRSHTSWFSGYSNSTDRSYPRRLAGEIRKEEHKPPPPKSSSGADSTHTDAM